MKSLTYVSAALVTIIVLASWAGSFAKKSENPEPTTRQTQIGNLECQMGQKSACK